MEAGKWFVDSEQRLCRREGGEGLDEGNVLSGNTPVTKMYPDGTTVWTSELEWRLAGRYATDAEVTQRMDAGAQWIHTRPESVLWQGAKWGSWAGADPEVFLERADGTLIEAFKVLPKKSEALKIRAAKCYWDGFQAEIGVDPHYCHAVLVDHIQAGLKEVLRYVRRGIPDARLAFKTVVEPSRDVLMGEKPEFVALGCKPSENAYGMQGMIVEEPRELGWRFAGGHYHFDPRAWRFQLTPAVIDRMVKAADVVAAMPAVAMFQRWDKPVRRNFYGLPGEHRRPEWGVEYRVLSNAWLFHPAVANFTLGLVRAGLKLGQRDLMGVFQYDEKTVVRTILDGDVDEAVKHVKRNEKAYEYLLKPFAEQGVVDYPSLEADPAKVLQASLAQLREPIDNFAPLTSMEENWCLNGEWKQQSQSPNAQWQSLVMSR